METANQTTQSGIMFKRSNLANFKQVSAPGKYKLKVLNNVSERNKLTDENGRERYIVTLKGIAPDSLAQLRETFKDAEEVGIEQTNGLFLTANIWKNGDAEPALPMKGEEVDCLVDYVKPRDGEEDEVVLRVTSLKVGAAQAASTIDVEKFFAPAEETEKEEAAEIAHS